MAEILDSGDKDDLEELLLSPGYALVRKRIEGTVADMSNELAADLDLVATAKLRGKIAGLKLALSVPQILIGEAE
jgi:hypothetical protein